MNHQIQRADCVLLFTHSFTLYYSCGQSPTVVFLRLWACSNLRSAQEDFLVCLFVCFFPLEEYPSILQCEVEVAPPTTVLDNLNLFLDVVILKKFTSFLGRGRSESLYFIIKIPFRRTLFYLEYFVSRTCIKLLLLVALYLLLSNSTTV